jgi:hypothetical protein
VTAVENGATHLKVVCPKDTLGTIHETVHDFGVRRLQLASVVDQRLNIP